MASLKTSVPHRMLIPKIVGSQINAGFQKIFVCQKMSEMNVGDKNVEQWKKFQIQRNLCCPKKILVQKIFVSKKCVTQKNLGPKKQVSKKNVGPKKLCVQTKVVSGSQKKSQKCVSQKFCVP